MSEAALRDMGHAGRALLEMLGGRDVRAVEDATARYRRAIDAVRASGGWHASPGLAAEARDILAGVDRLTLSVRDLTAASAHRLAALEAAGATPLYGRAAR